MGVLNENTIIGASGGEDAYTIDYSCRFDSASSSKLSRTPSGAGNRRTYTISFWFKRGVTAGAHMYPFDADGNGDIYILTSSEKLGSQGYGSGYHTATQVLRDMSNWYHLIIAVDTTQGSASNRVKHYLNGSQITVWDSDSQPSQNADSDVNNTVAHTIGGKSGGNYFDGYIAEFNLIDGTALTPSSFGETGDYEVWKPIEYTGSHGTNGFYLDFKNAGIAYSSGDRTSDITVSTNMSAGDGLYSSSGAVDSYFVNGSLTATGNRFGFENGVAVAGHYIRFQWGSGQTLTGAKWYTDSTANHGTWKWQGSNNASDWTDIGSSFALNLSSGWNTSVGTQLNSNTTAYTYYQLIGVSGNGSHTGNQTEIEFGTGTPSANGLGTDASGEGNHFTPTNLAASDQVTDTPTNNFPVMNNLNNQPFVTTFAEGNLEITTGGTNHEPANMATFGMSSGKWYFEVYQKSGGTGGLLGIRSQQPGSISPTAKDNPGKSADGYAYYGDSSYGVYANNAQQSYGTAVEYTNGDIISIAVDLTNNKIYWAKNGTWVNSGNPAGNSNGYSITAASSTSTGEYFPCFGDYDASSYVFLANFGQDGTFAGNVTAGGNSDGSYGNFKYSVPSGFKALCSQNLDDPTVIPLEHFNAVLYSGSGSSQTITTGLQPDLCWVKNRDRAGDPVLVDILRGAGQTLFSHSNAAEADNASGGAMTIGSSGFTVSGVDDWWNRSGDDFVSWNWKANGSGSSNGDGSITSTVSANTSAGFSIVSYSGDNSTATVGHGLSKAPELLIVKRRSGADNWTVGSIQSLASMDFTDSLLLDTTGALVDETIWNDTAPTSSVFTVTSNTRTNGSGSTYIAYCFHSVEGYSKIGAYKANGDDDGPFIYTGFTPKFLMSKRINAVGDWIIKDTVREPYNPSVKEYPAANLNNAEAGTDYYIDFLSNGFKLRTSGRSNFNNSTDQYLWIVFADKPFKHSNAR